MLSANRPLLESLRDLLLEKKTIDAKTLAGFAGDKAAAKEPWPEGDLAVGGTANRKAFLSLRTQRERSKR